MYNIDTQVLLNSFPHPAMIIREDRKILAANNIAKNLGAVIGVFCWEGFANAKNLSDEHYEKYRENPDTPGIQCFFCRADNCLTNQSEENDPLLESHVGIFDTYWVPISRNTYLHYAIDITEIKKSEREIKQLADRLLLATESAQLGVWDWNTRENTMVWNDRMFELYGVKREETPNNIDAWLNGLHPEDKEAAIAACQAALNGEKDFYTEFRVLHPEGTVKHIKANGLVIMGADGKPDRMLGVNADITYQKKAEQEKIKGQQLLEQMGAISNVGGWLYDIDTEALAWTGEVYKIHEVDSGFIPNVKDAMNFYSDASKPIIAEAVQKLIEDREPYDLELEIITAKGNLRHVHTKGFADHENRRIYGAIHDITEKKNYQQAQLRSGQLSALGEVAAGVAHEINNPINGVINYAQLLINRNSENEQSNQILERIIREGNRIATIVKNLLNFATKDRNAFSSLDIADIVTEPLNLKAQLLKEDGINIELRVPSELPKIYGNRMQLEQVVLNLLSNARHALNKKYPDLCNEKFIFIEAVSSNDNNGGCVQLSIKDFGCGIANEHLDKIFNPFFTTKEAGVGTGLGLSVSHEILEKHNATISVESEIDKFTNITMTFRVDSQ